MVSSISTNNSGLQAAVRGEKSWRRLFSDSVAKMDPYDGGDHNQLRQIFSRLLDGNDSRRRRFLMAIKLVNDVNPRMLGSVGVTMAHDLCDQLGCDRLGRLIGRFPEVMSHLPANMQNVLDCRVSGRPVEPSESSMRRVMRAPHWAR